MLWLLPTMPTTELKLSTSGSLRRSSSSECCASTMPWKEMPCSASVVALMKPMSSVGRKPLGMIAPSQAVASRSSREASRVSRRCRSTTSSEAAYLPASQSKARSMRPYMPS